MLNNNPETNNTDIQQVIVDVMSAVKQLAQGEKVKTVDLFAPIVWQGTSPSEHKWLGKQVAKLTREKRLPLLITDRTSANHLQFIVDK